MDAAEKEYGFSNNNDWYKFKEGKNRIRLLTAFIPFASHYKAGACLGKADCPICKADKEGKTPPSVKYLCYVLDYDDNATIKLAQLPWNVSKSIQDLQADPEYAFEEVPMPYGITINATGAGKKEVVYSVIPSAKREPLSPEIMEKIASLKAPEEVKEAMKNKKMRELGLMPDKKTAPMPTADQDEISPEDIGF